MKSLEELAWDYLETSSIAHVTKGDVNLLTNYFDKLVVETEGKQAKFIQKLTAENIKMKVAIQNMADVFKDNV